MLMFVDVKDWKNMVYWELELMFQFFLYSNANTTNFVVTLEIHNVYCQSSLVLNIVIVEYIVEFFANDKNLVHCHKKKVLEFSFISKYERIGIANYE